jgi:hypothetical protein
MDEHEFDVVVVGSTPGGLTAGIAAARAGCSVAVLERSQHLGGLPANGLGVTDILTRDATGGLFEAFVGRVRGHYVETYGADSEQVAACSDGYHFEPSVAESVFEAMVDDADGLEVRCGRQFDPNPDAVTLDGRRLAEIEVTDRESGAVETYVADAFVDATYEGDLAAAAGAPYRLGREGKAEFDEPYAGVVYKQVRGPVGPGTTNQADNAIQAYNYRLCLTDDAENRVEIEKPDGYDRAEYASLVDDIEAGRHTGADDDHVPEGMGWFVLRGQLPNGKVDANNNGFVFVSTDLPEENWPWPTAGWAWRDRFAQRLRDYTLGLLWFAQNDPAVPDDVQEAARRWGLAADEYEDNDHFPRQVYVREGRRVEGEHLFTAHDARPTAEGERPPVYASSVTAAHYPIDSHATRKREPGRVNLEGFLSGIHTEPYTVPLGVAVPQSVDGLLAPVPVSGTHLGFSTLRMEPCWMALGEAAGVAAAVAQERDERLRSVPVAAVQRRLLDHGAVLMHYEDAGPGDPHYEALQFLGVRGFVPEWEARLDEAVEAETAADWCAWADVSPDVHEAGDTRGELLSKLDERLRERPPTAVADVGPE